MAYQNIIARFQQQQEAARLMNEKRYEEALKLYSQIIEQYEPGGAFGEGYEAQLERTKTRDIAASQQALVSGGLFGTSVTAGLPKKWEEEVGQPARLKLEDVRMGRYAEAIEKKAGLIERREDVGPDYATIAQLSAQAAARPTQMYQQPAPTTWGQYKPHPPATKMVTRPQPVGAAYTPSRTATRTGTQVTAPSVPYSQTPAGIAAAQRYAAQQAATGQEFPGSYIHSQQISKQIKKAVGSPLSPWSFGF